jgi:hypothetical protein
MTASFVVFVIAVAATVVAAVVRAQAPGQGSWISMGDDVRCGRDAHYTKYGYFQTAHLDVSYANPWYDAELDGGICTGAGVKMCVDPAATDADTCTKHYAIDVPLIGNMTRRRWPSTIRETNGADDAIFQQAIDACVPAPRHVPGESLNWVTMSYNMKKIAAVESERRARRLVEAMLRPAFADYVRRHGALVRRDDAVVLGRPDLQACLDSVINYACTRVMPPVWYDADGSGTYTDMRARRPVCRHVCENIVNTCHVDLRLPQRIDITGVAELKPLLASDGPSDHELLSVGAPYDAHTCDAFTVNDTSYPSGSEQQVSVFTCAGATMRRYAAVDWASIDAGATPPSPSSVVVPITATATAAATAMTAAVAFV